MGGAESLFERELKDNGFKHCANGDLCLVGQVPQPRPTAPEAPAATKALATPEAPAAKPAKSASERPTLVVPPLEPSAAGHGKEVLFPPPNRGGDAAAKDSAKPLPHGDQAAAKHSAKPPHHDKPLVEPEIPTARDSDSWRSKHNDFADRAKLGHIDTVFYGDSITEAMHLDPLFKNGFGKAADFGIESDSTQHLIWRMKNGETAFPKNDQPSKGVILIGANNIGKTNSNEEIAKGVVAAVKEATKDMPNTKWLVGGLLPQGVDASDPRRAEISDINARVSKALNAVDAAGHPLYPNVEFDDVGAKMLDRNGTMNPDIWRGSKHPRLGAGYGRMLRLIKDRLDAPDFPRHE